MHGPLTAAITGLNISLPLSKLLIVGFSQNVPLKSPVLPAGSRRSAPPQNTLPLPVRMATHALSSSLNLSHAAFCSLRICPLIAFC